MPPTLFSSANTNTAQFLICLLGGICCLIPLGMSSIVDFTQSPLLFTLTSLRFRDSAVFAASVTLPLFFEVTFEIISAIVTGKKTGKSKMNVDAVLLNTRERFLLFCGIVTIPMTALLPSNTYHLVNLYMCLRRSRTVFVFGGVVTSLSRYDNNNWPVRKCYLMLISLICGAAIGAFADNYSLLGAPSHLRNVSTVFNVCFSGTFVYCNCMWLCSDIPRLFKGFFSISGDNTIDTIQNSRGISRCPNLISPLVYATSTTLVGCLSVAAAMTFGGADNYGADALFLHNLMFIIYLLMIMYISERMLKNEVVRGLHALIESKKMYVRYISHELRTPLNSAFLGLKLVCEESAEDENSNHLETLLDVQSACKIAVEILNDLLCFDKLESGILELHKHDVAVTPFINDCVNMFVSQAREAGVSISITSEDPSLSPLHQGRGSDVREGLREGDIVCMDKFKMDQVLRNLISNALKFTPRGGSVTVCASFVESENSPAPTHSLSNRSTNTGTVRDFVRTWHGRLLGVFGRSSSPNNGVRRSSAGYSGWNALQSEETFGATSSQIEECQRGGSFSNDIGIEDIEGNGHGNGNGSVSSSSQYRALSNADWESTVSSQDRILHEHDEYTEFQGNQIVSGKLRIAVTDTGAGISEANQARLFKEVVQFNPEVLQAGGGSGLGLWITNSIVQMHSGSIRVSSKGPGQGTSFIVEIDMQRRTSSLTSRQPIATSSTATATATASASATASATSTGLECRVGIRADDDVNTAHRVPAIIISRSMSMSTSRCTSAEQSTDISEAGVAIKSEAEVGVEEESLTGMRAKGAYDYTKQLKGTPHPFYMPCSPHAVVDLPFSPLGPVTAPPLSPLSSLAPLATLDSGQKGKERFRFNDPDPPIERSYDILVVDDSGLNRKLLCRLLRASRHICDEANDGLAALERVKIKMAGELGAKLRYDVILIDFVMPVMDGPTATKAIRALGYESLILGVTGNTLDSDINHFVKCGADAVLAKPFDFAAFRAHMTAHEQNHSFA